MSKFQKRFLSLPELAARWGYGDGTMRNQISRGTLPIPVNRLLANGDPRFAIEDVEAHEAASKIAKAA